MAVQGQSLSAEPERENPTSFPFYIVVLVKASCNSRNAISSVLLTTFAHIPYQIEEMAVLHVTIVVSVADSMADCSANLVPNRQVGMCFETHTHLADLLVSRFDWPIPIDSRILNMFHRVSQPTFTKQAFESARSALESTNFNVNSIYGGYGSRNYRRIGRPAMDLKNRNAGPKLHWHQWEKSVFPALPHERYFSADNKGHDGDTY